MISVLRAGALTAVDHGFELRLALPWIRSLPVSGLTDLHVRLDDQPVEPLQIVLGSVRVSADRLADVDHWWFLQDRLVVAGAAPVSQGRHPVAVDFRMLIPYLPGPAGTSLVLPFHADAVLAPTDPAPGVSRDVGAETLSHV